MKPSNNRKNAIVTFAIGYQSADVQMFLESCRQIELDADIYLFCGKNFLQLRGELAAYPHVIVKRLPETFFSRQFLRGMSRWPLVGKLYAHALRSLYRILPSGYSELLHSLVVPTQHLMSKRFFILNSFISRHSYQNYLFTDIRDVLVQTDPFKDLKTYELHTGADCVKIGEDSKNKRWVDITFSKGKAEALHGLPIICAGVILGSARIIREYLEAYIEQVYFTLPNTINKFGSDQAIHSYLFHFGLPGIEKRIHNNNTGSIVTLDHENPGNCKWNNRKMINSSGDVIWIVHQYDRHPDLVHRFRDCILKNTNTMQMVS